MSCRGLFADVEFASAFGVRGKPGISPGQLAMVTVLQFAENLTDRQAADAVRGRIGWKYALGLELSDPGFDHTVLTGFRRRLIDHDWERRSWICYWPDSLSWGWSKPEVGSVLMLRMCLRRCDQ
jgi:hypothetical protein